jgi:DNA polymerase I
MKALTDYADLVRDLCTLQPGPVFTDTETTGLNPRTDTLVLVQLYQPHLTHPIIIDMRESWPTWKDRLSEVFERHLLVAHNAKFDVSMLLANGMKVGAIFDTMIAEQVLQGVGMEDARQHGINLSLAGLAEKYAVTNHPISKAEREWFDTTLPLDIKQEIPEAQIVYSCIDVEILAKIHREQAYELQAKPALKRTIDLEMRVLPALVDVELTGISINVPAWREFIAGKAEQAKEHEDQVLATFGRSIIGQRLQKYDFDMLEFEKWEAAKQQEEEDLRMAWDCPEGGVRAFFGDKWGEFKTESMKRWRAEHPTPGRPKLDLNPPNVGSAAQLLTAFGELGLPFVTTDSKKLAPYEHQYPAIGTLIKYRKAQKFVDSFGESLLAFVEADGRIHPEYNQIGASTGRMSCTRPNWQQVPSRGDGKRLRQCVVARPGYQLLTADFSNIEMRILAEYSRDERLLDFFDREVDLHSEVARMMFNLPYDADPKSPCPAVPGWSYRDVAKTINYGLVYGMTATRLERTAMVSKAEAERLMQAYFDLFPRVVTWLASARKAGWDRSYSRTMLGRIRPYTLPRSPGYNASWAARNEYQRAKARIERQSMNTPIQGTSADITKEALARYYEFDGPNKGHVVAIVHDELVVEVMTEYAKHYQCILADCMDQAQHLICRLRPDQEEPRVKLESPEVHMSDRWEK